MLDTDTASSAALSVMNLWLIFKCSTELDACKGQRAPRSCGSSCLGGAPTPTARRVGTVRSRQVNTYPA